MSNEEFKEYVKKYVKEDLLKEFKWLEDVDVELCYHGSTVVDLLDLDVNWERWHNNELTGNRMFKFDAKDYVHLNIVNYQEFKQVLRDYEHKYIKGE